MLRPDFRSDRAQQRAVFGGPAFLLIVGHDEQQLLNEPQVLVQLHRVESLIADGGSLFLRTRGLEIDDLFDFVGTKS